jgi:hypothetical protein
MVYALLTFKWFFAEKIHREKVFLTMATHQPLPIMINIYLIHTALASGGVYERFTWKQFILLLIFSLPVTAWETSRKIRSADKETSYVTFSSIFGARGASFIPLACLLITGTLSLYVGYLLDFSLSYNLAVTILFIYILFYYLRFIINPVNENNMLKNAAMVYTTLLFLNMLVHTLINFRIVVQI